MTERLPYVQQNRQVSAGAGHNAQEWRWLNAALGPAGVVGATALKVSPASLMNVSVAAGGALIPDGQSPSSGLYHAFNDAAVTVPIAASDLTQSRIDRVVFQVLDSALGDVEDRARIFVVKGANAASNPTTPAAPRGSLSLATVSVPANLSAVAAGNITDLRVAGGSWAASYGLVHLVDATNFAAGLRQSLGELDTLITTTVPTVAGRRYSVGFSAVIFLQNADDAGNVNMTFGSFPLQRLWQSRAVVAGQSFAVNVRTQTFTATGSSLPLTVQHQRTLGTGALTLDNNFGPIILTVLDEGGAVL